MGGNYQKIMMEMEQVSRRFCLWKKLDGAAICRLEAYKEKRAVFLSVTNLLPSKTLYRDHQFCYMLLLMGVQDGQLVHRQFGPVHVDARGEGVFYTRFSGPPLDCYTHCVLAAVAEKDETEAAEPAALMILYQGLCPTAATFAQAATPEQKEDEDESLWQSLIHACVEDCRVDIFAQDVDETGASWYWLQTGKEMPAALVPCQEAMEKYGHFLLGHKEDRWFVAIPGRFLQKEQPDRAAQHFLLWQPLKGGERFFRSREEMTPKEQEIIYGYWIAEVSMEKQGLKSL